MQDPFICVSYAANLKTIVPGPLSGNAIAQRIRFLLQSHVGLTRERAALFASHSLRRGGATYMRARGVSDRDIQTMGRWES